MSTSVRSLLRRGWLVRAAIAGALLAALLTVQNDLTALAPAAYHPFVRLALLVVAIGLGATAVREVVNAIFRTVDRQGAVVWRNLSSWTLYALVGLMIASALNVNLSGLLVGGAIIGVIVATASQASLGNFFAGLVLMLVRPYQVGAAIRLRGPLSAGGPDFEGTVVDMGALYTTLRTAPGDVLKLPNSSVVSSALRMGEAPLQAEVEVELPPNTPLRPLEEAVKERIGRPGTWVFVRPRTIRALGESTLVCQVEVRSLTPIEPMVLAEALIQAVAKDGHDGEVHADSSLAS
jgi:small-conductance mechanosensitive channel